MRPCEYALIRIGKPASNATLEHLTKEKDSHRRRLLCDVILAVEGNKTAAFLIEDKIKSAVTQATRQNLELARDIIVEKPVPKSK